MEKELVKKLRERGRHFLKVALFDAKEKNFDVALFHLEQSLQLLLKSKLLEKIGEFPKTHRLTELIRLLGKLLPSLKKVAEKNWSYVDILEDAYIGARYLGFEYTKKEFDACLRFVKKVWKVVR